MEKEKREFMVFKVGTHDGTSPCDLSLQQIAGSCRIVWTGN